MARSFDGTNDSMQASIDLSAENKITVVFQQKQSAFVDNDDLQCEHTASTNSNVGGFFLDPNGSGTVWAVAHRQDSGGSTSGSFPRPSTGSWHRFVVEMDMGVNPGTIKAWVDGVAQTITYSLQQTNTANTFANDTFNFCSRNNANLFLACELQEFAIFSGSLTANQIASHNKGAAPPLFGAPLYYWRLPGNSSPELELVKGADATVNGAAKFTHELVTYPASPMIGHNVAAVVAGGLPAGSLALGGVGI